MKKKTAIVYVVTKLELGGAQKICLRLFNDLQSKDTDTFLFSGTSGALVDQVKEKPQVTLLPSFVREISFLNLWKDIKTTYLLVRHFKKIKTEYKNVIVHTHSTKAGYIGRIAAWLAGIPKRIHTIHGFGFHSHQSYVINVLAFTLEWISSLVTTEYICVSSHEYEIGKKYFLKFTKRAHIIRAAVDETKFIPAKKTTNQYFTFGTVACFKPQKNLFDLLEAFKLIHALYPYTRLEIIGDGIQRKEIENWITENKLNNAITLLGWQQNIQTHMARWQAFTLSSLWEGLPCAIVEARFLKIPVIAYNVGGIADIIEHGKNGFLCKPKNIHAFTAHMEQLITQHVIRHKLQEYAEPHISNFYTNTMIHQHKNLY